MRKQSQLHDPLDDDPRRRVHPVEEGHQGVTLRWLQHRRGRPEEKCGEDEGQQVHLCGGAHRVPWNDLHQAIANGEGLGRGRRRFRTLLVLRRDTVPHLGIQGRAGLDQDPQIQTNGGRDQRAEQEEGQRASTDAPQSPDVAYGAGAHEEAGHHQRHHHHADEADEGRAQGLQRQHRTDCSLRAGRLDHDSHHCTQHQTQEDFRRQLHPFSSPRSPTGLSVISPGALPGRPSEAPSTKPP